MSEHKVIHSKVTLGSADAVEGVETSQDTDTSSSNAFENSLTAAEPSVPVVASETVCFNESSGAVEGEFDASDVRFPYLRIVAGSGRLSEMFQSSSVILGDDVLLPPPNPQNPDPSHMFRFVPLHIKKSYRENLSKDEMDAGQLPRTVDTLQEVTNYGGTIQWIDNVKPSWAPMATIQMLVEAPEGCDHPSFVFESDGKLYAPAIYSAASSAYKEAALNIFNAARTTLRSVVKDENGAIVKDENGNPLREIMLHKSWWTWRRKNEL